MDNSFFKSSKAGYHYTHFINEKIEAQSGRVTNLKARQQQVAGLAHLIPKPSISSSALTSAGILVIPH